MKTKQKKLPSRLTKIESRYRGTSRTVRTVQYRNSDFFLEGCDFAGMKKKNV
jgi:hypothetical protein